MSIYPGTQDYEEAVGRGWLECRTYCTGHVSGNEGTIERETRRSSLARGLVREEPRTEELDTCPPRTNCARSVSAWGAPIRRHSSNSREALIEEGDLEEAERLPRRALELGYPLPGIVHNALACIALRRGHFAQVKDELVCAARIESSALRSLAQRVRRA
ncbi:MAG: hypothetical protein QM784_03115 [Polyangiaceae bacterium]